MAKTLEGGSTNSETFINITRVILGMGILTMPSAMARIGIIPAILISVFVPFLSYFTWTWAVDLKERCGGEAEPLWSSEIACESGSTAQAAIPDKTDPLRACMGGFDIVVQHVLGTSGRVLFIALVLAVQFSAGISYISAMEEGVKILFPTVSHNLGLMAITVVLMGTTLLAPNLRDIAFLSFASALVLVYLFVSMPIEGVQRMSETRTSSSVILLDLSASYMDWGYTFGAVGFSYCGFACGLCLYEDMKHPEDYNQVTGVAFIASASLAIIFGFVGYWAFGGGVKELAYLNFPAGSMTSYICVVSYNFILLATYLVMVTPVFLVAHGFFPSTPYSVIRCTVIILTAVCSRLLPSVMQVLLLLNIISAQLSELAIPALCYLWKGKAYDFPQRCIALLCIITAVVGGAAGFVSAIESFRSQPAVPPRLLWLS